LYRIQAVNDTINQDKTDKQDSSESDLESDNNNNASIHISSRQKRPPAAFKTKPDNTIAERKANLPKQYKSDKEYSNDSNSLLNILITKRFPGHGSLNGKIIAYHPASHNYSITYQDGDSEVMSHSNILKYVKGTKQYHAHHENQLALCSAFYTAMSSNSAQSDNVPENYTDARAAPDVADWMKAYDIEMGKLRSLGCWEVLPRSSLPQNASVMTRR